MDVAHVGSFVRQEKKHAGRRGPEQVKEKSVCAKKQKVERDEALQTESEASSCSEDSLFEDDETATGKLHLNGSSVSKNGAGMKDESSDSLCSDDTSTGQGGKPQPKAAGSLNKRAVNKYESGSSSDSDESLGEDERPQPKVTVVFKEKYLQKGESNNGSYFDGYLTEEEEKPQPKAASDSSDSDHTSDEGEEKPQPEVTVVLKDWFLKKDESTEEEEKLQLGAASDSSDSGGDSDEVEEKPQPKVTVHLKEGFLKKLEYDRFYYGDSSCKEEEKHQSAKKDKSRDSSDSSDSSSEEDVKPKDDISRSCGTAMKAASTDGSQSENLHTRSGGRVNHLGVDTRWTGKKITFTDEG